MIFSGNVELIRNMRKYIYILSGSKHHTYGSCVQISVLFCVCYINSGKSPDKLAASGQQNTIKNEVIPLCIANPYELSFCFCFYSVRPSPWLSSGFFLAIQPRRFGV